VGNLIDMIRTAITPDVVRHSSSLTGESDAATRNAIDVAIPTVLAGTVELGSTQAGAERLVQMIADGGYGPETVSGFAHMLAEEHARESLERSGGHLLSSLFGSREEEVTQAVAQASSVEGSSAAHVLRFIAPLVMGVLGRQIGSLRLDGRGAMNLLLGERSTILSALPPGVARAIGISEVVEEPRLIEHEPSRTIKVARRSRFRPAMLGTLAVLTLLFFLTRNRDRESDVVRVNVPPAAELERPMMPAPQPSAPSARFTELDAYLTGPVDQPARVLILEDVTFETHSSRLKEDAKATLHELAKILKSHPETKVRIEGHTDDQGGPSANRRLSLDRANSVKAALVSSGANGGSIETKGVGAEKPSAPSQNQRMVVVVVK
jgi:outer membrane protein OmpA-like peptidoglycan-associated protein